jgi:bifunctional non-homologous end joining protein LigD
MRAALALGMARVASKRPVRLRLPRALQLATLVDRPPEGDEWLHEQKFDGYRMLAVIEDGEVRLLSRRFKDWTAELPSIARALAELSVSRALIDGEVVALLPDGRTSFQALQNSFGGSGADLAYVAFDLLAEGGEDLGALPLEKPKARLQQLVARRTSPTVRYSDHLIGRGAELFRIACRRGLEGIVSKRRDKPYLEGRGTTWLKTKCLLRQELVIGGFTDPEGSREGIGALLVGYHDNDRLVYAGKVGTGYTRAMLVDLRQTLERLEQAASPFEPEPPRAWTGPSRHWVRPEYVAEVAFSEWTADGRLRHPSFQGLREDKLASEIVREEPMPARGE